MKKIMKKIENNKSNELISLSTNDKKIAEIGKKYNGLVISDIKTFELCKAARTHMVSLRTGIAKALKVGVKPFKDIIELNKKEAARLTALVVEIEEPLQKTVKAWESKKAEEKAENERIEADRIAKHKAVNQKIITLGNLAYGASIEDIEKQLTELNDIVVDSSLEEFEEDSKTAKSTSNFMLESALIGAREQEKRDDERRIEDLRLEKERKELQERQEKIDAEKKKLEEQREKIESDNAQFLKDQEDAKKFLISWDDAIKINEQFNYWSDEIYENRNRKADKKLFLETNGSKNNDELLSSEELRSKIDDEKLKEFFNNVYKFAESCKPELELEKNRRSLDNFMTWFIENLKINIL